MMETHGASHERAALDLLIRGFEVSRMLRLVADLGVADWVAEENGAAIADLAQHCGVQPQPLVRVLRALAAFGVFSVAPDGTITHTPRSSLLRTDAPGSLHYSARFWAGPGSWRAWESLDVALSGGVPYESAWNMGRFEYLRSHPEEARAFDAMMAHFPDDRHAAIAAAYDFSGARLIADIGGGNGAALRHILARFPMLEGLVFDREDVVRAIQAADLMDGRIAVAGGSFFEAVPVEADVYLLIRVLHDWSDAECLRILRACRAAMRPQARILIGEQLLDPDPAHGEPTGYLIDIQMMAMFGSARSRTEVEFRSLLAESGLELRRIIPTSSSPVSLLEAVPI